MPALKSSVADYYAPSSSPLQTGPGPAVGSRIVTTGDRPGRRSEAANPARSNLSRPWEA